MREAKIIVNGVELSEAQAMTVRVALGSFYQDLAANGLGDDPVGRGICEGYKTNALQVQELLLRPQRLHVLVLPEGWDVVRVVPAMCEPGALYHPDFARYLMNHLLTCCEAGIWLKRKP